MKLEYELHSLNEILDSNGKLLELKKWRDEEKYNREMNIYSNEWMWRSLGTWKLSSIDNSGLGTHQQSRAQTHSYYLTRR